MQPSEIYAPYVDAVKEKIHLSKCVIEFLANNMDATYEDLLNKIQVVYNVNHFYHFIFNVCFVKYVPPIILARYCEKI